MDEQTLMAINAYPNFQDYHVLLISPTVISSSKKAVCKKNSNEEVNIDPENGWPFLPTELLNLIMTRLSSMADLSNFRAVCPTWRSLRPENLAYQSPLLLLASPKKDIFGLYDFTRKRLYNMRLSIRTQQEPEEPYNIEYATCLTYSHGFLVIANMPGFTEIMLYSIFTGNRIMLPAVKQAEGDLRFIFSSSPSSPGCLVVMFQCGSFSFHFCCIGDIEWKCHCLYLSRLHSIDDMIFFDGKLYVLTFGREFISIRFGCCLEQILVEKVEVLANMSTDEHSLQSRLRLAQSCSELLLVRKWRTYHFPFDYKYIDRFSIYRWDFSAGAWTQVSSLGGRALFFTDNKFMASVPPTCFGIQPNGIYCYPPRYYYHSQMKTIIWSEGSMEDGTFRTVCPEPPSKELTSAITWILPSMS